MSKIIKLYFVDKFTEGDEEQQLAAMGKYFEFVALEDADVIFCGSIVTMEMALKAKETTQKPLAVYCWDYYLFAHDGRHTGWNWKQYAQLLNVADIIFVPSAAQQLRLKELLGLDSIVVRSGILTYEHEVTDAGFVLDPIRYYPYEQAKWPEKAASELGIPIIHSEHQFSREEYRKLVASCSFMTCAVPEASTGGLSLIEGLWLGKPSLVSNSPYNGAQDYLGELGYYFQWDSYEDFKRMMQNLWETRPTLSLKSVRPYISHSLSFEAMALSLHKEISVLKIKKNIDI